MAWLVCGGIFKFSHEVMSIGGYISSMVQLLFHYCELSAAPDKKLVPVSQEILQLGNSAASGIIS